MKQITIADSVGKTIKKTAVIDDAYLVIIFESDEFALVRAESFFDSARICTVGDFCTRYRTYSEVSEAFGDEQAKVFHTQWVKAAEEMEARYAAERQKAKRIQYETLKKEFDA